MRLIPFARLQLALTAGITASALSLTGCIVIPIPAHDDIVMAGRAVRTNRIAEIQANLTDKATVLEKLGPPAAIWEDERIFLYWWDARQAKVYWVLSGSTGAAGGVQDVPRHYMAFVQFDNQDRVQRIERVVRSETNSLCVQLVRWANAGHSSHRPAPATQRRQKTLLLFRIIATAEGKPLQEATRGWFGNHDIFSTRTLAAGLGTFYSIGVPEWHRPKKAEPDAGQTGWYYYELEPGTYYFGLQGYNSYYADPSHSLAIGVRFRIDVPIEGSLVYAGTVRLECTLSGGGVHAQWTRSAEDIEQTTARVEDEASAAVEVAARLRPGLALTTRIMKPHSGPYVLRTPARQQTPALRQ